jgi:hypothetical protein
MNERESATVTFCGRDGVEHTYYPPGWYVMREKSHTIPLILYEDRFWMAWDPYRDDQDADDICAGSPSS